MDKNNIPEILEGVFSKVFNDPNLKLNDDMTAKDVDKWDSLTHMILIDAIEKQFGIKFKLRDLIKMKNVGDMKRIIVSYL